MKSIVSPATVKTHINWTLAKLGLSSRAQLVVVVYEEGAWCGPLRSETLLFAADRQRVGDRAP